MLWPYIYGHFVFLVDISHISVGLRHDPPTIGGKFDAHQRAIDPALVCGGLGFEA